jgi:hypothetical protein
MTRIEREARTVRIMIALYCRRLHHARRDSLCPDCAGLQAYALQRLQRCPFKAAKPACKDCAVHCYQPAQREQVRRVMRFSGPRMVLRRPWLAVCHLLRH